MKFKKLMFVAIFLMAIFAVGAVSAADNVTQDKILEDVASEEPIASNDMKDSLSEDDVYINIQDKGLSIILKVTLATLLQIWLTI